MSGRIWTPEENDYMTQNYTKIPAATIAKRLNRSCYSVCNQAKKLGVARPKNTFIWDENSINRLIELHAQGITDTEIAKLFRCERHTVGVQRRKLGLAMNAGATASQHFRKRVRDKTMEIIRRKGLNSLADERSVAFKKFAESSGWPGDLRPRSIQILNLLAANGLPMTRRQIAEGIGMRWRGTRGTLSSNDPERSYLAHLAARNLVVIVGSIPGTGRGSRQHLYTLGPAALEILQSRINENNNEQQ